mmetsp:Transcript_40799/g.91681  ORF Transcript_40799/g.91681 Transcript_40799/m.91681 type:complete len:94 (+) Transcript_40799:1921-2202(+)
MLRKRSRCKVNSMTMFTTNTMPTQANHILTSVHSLGVHDNQFKQGDSDAPLRGMSTESKRQCGHRLGDLTRLRAPQVVQKGHGEDAADGLATA